MIKTVERTAYYAPTARRHFFTKKAAAKREASAILKNKYPTERPEYERGYCIYEGWHWTNDPRLVKVYERLYKRFMNSL